MENVLKRREMILKAAQETFFRKSFYEATMDDIAKLSGIKKPTIYYYFSSKIDLASELLEIYIKKTFDKINEIISTNKDIKKKIEMMINYYINLLEEDAKIFIVMERIFFDFMQKEESKNKINELFQKLKNKQKKTGKLLGEIKLVSGGKISGELFLFSLIASLGRVIFENTSQGKNTKKDDLLSIGDIFTASVE
ncbi:MAG: hypothetical protein Kow00103_07510 [Candidatus Caldatribacteriota bacterium]